jgi:hypothetical protein
LIVLARSNDGRRERVAVDLHPLPPVCDLGGRGAVGEEPGYLISSGRDLGGVASGVVEELPDFGLEDP